VDGEEDEVRAHLGAARPVNSSASGIAIGTASTRVILTP
jgi:hypothetical protein